MNIHGFSSLDRKSILCDKILLLFSVAILLFLDLSCKKSANTLPAITANTAQPQYDHNAGGLYKGVLVGSSGYFVIYIKNGDNKVFALLNFDNVHDSLVCPALNNYTPGSGDVTNALFTSALNTSDSIILSVSADGSNPSVKVTLPGHTTNVFISKETSTSIIKLFMGNDFDTLIAGGFRCNCNRGVGVYHNILGTLKVKKVNFLIQGNVMTILQGHAYIPADCIANDCESWLGVLTLNPNSQVEFNADPGCTNGRGKIIVSDSDITGTVIAPRPVSCFQGDAYNSYIKATRVN